MKLKQISVPIENSQGRLATLTRSLGEKGITSRWTTTLSVCWKRLHNSAWG